MKRLIENCSKEVKRTVCKIVDRLNSHFPFILVQIRYFIRQKHFANLSKPQDLNEKILWLALKTDTTDWSRLADKYEVRNYVANCGLKEILIPMYGVWDNADEIDFGKLPNSFILKPTFGSGNTIRIDNKVTADLECVRRKIRDVLNNYYVTSPAELHYKRIPRRILAEKLVENDEVSKKLSTSLIDYKFWCFNGKVQYIYVCSNRNKKKNHIVDVMLYDREWNAHPEYCRETEKYPFANQIPKPKCLDNMIGIAEKLSNPFPVVRVDLYNLDGAIYFGEMTFTSDGANMDYFTNDFLVKAGNEIKPSYLK